MATQNINSNLFRRVKTPSFGAVLIMPPTKAILNTLPAKEAPGWVRRLVFRSALKRAYSRFAGCYPEWAASLFDEQFLNHGTMSLLAGYVREGCLPEAGKLTLAWDAQFGPTSPAVRQRRIAELNPVAADFLEWLTLELAINPFL